MILQVKNNPEQLQKGKIVAFLTGKNSINTYPKYLRIGEVVDAEKWIVKDLETGRRWNVYSGDVMITNSEVRGVKATIELTDKP